MNQRDFISYCQSVLGDADWRNRYHGKALAVLLPKTTQEVAKIVKACDQALISIVPQGGNTSMCGAATQ
ncbi:MAG: hypothetical protein RL350_1094 [Pseudomonadota bacterium]